MDLIDQKISDAHSSSSFKEKNRTWIHVFYLCFHQGTEFPDCVSNVSGFHQTEDTADGFSCFNHIINIILLTGKKSGGERKQ